MDESGQEVEREDAEQGRILTTHVGNRVRPPEPVELLPVRGAGGDIDPDRDQRTLCDAVPPWSRSRSSRHRHPQRWRVRKGHRPVAVRAGASDGFEYRPPAGPGAGEVVPNTPERLS